MKIILIISVFINILFADIFSDNNKKEIIKQVNLNYPMRLDDSATLVNFTIIGDTFMYMANVDNRSSFSYQEKELVKKRTARGVCTDNRTLPFLKKGLRCNYSYRNTNTYEVFYQFDVTIKDCR